MQLKKYDDAIKSFNKALELNPEDADALNFKGTSLYLLNELRKGLGFINDAIKINPEYSDAYFNKGLILTDLKKYDEAIIAFDKVLKIDKSNENALFYKGNAFFQEGKFKLALSCFDEILNTNTKDPEVWNIKGATLISLDKTEDALKCYDKALEIDPDYELSLFNKGMINKDEKKPEEALKYFDRIVKINPEYAEAWYQRGNILKDLKRENDSNKSYKRFVELVGKYKISELELTASRVKEFLFKNENKGEEIIVSPRKEPWYWQWSTKPEYFLGSNNQESPFLEPEAVSHPGESWWTCHKDTRAGDLILLYRAGKQNRKTYQDIKYLIMATSDAYSITDDEYAFEHGWKYGCDYETLFKFKNSLTLDEIRKDPYLDDWNAFKALFRLSAYRTQPKHWNRINELLADKNPDYKKFLEKPDTKEKIQRIKSELELEDALYKKINVLKKFGYDVELVGRQVICKGEGGFMDLLCKNKKDNSYLVIELKIVPADQNTYAQISYYMSWVKERMANGMPVKGLIISKGTDNRFKLAIKHDQDIDQKELSEVLSLLGMKMN